MSATRSRNLQLGLALLAIVFLGLVAWRLTSEPPEESITRPAHTEDVSSTPFSRPTANRQSKSRDPQKAPIADSGAADHQAQLQFALVLDTENGLTTTVESAGLTFSVAQPMGWILASKVDASDVVYALLGRQGRLRLIRDSELWRDVREQVAAAPGLTLECRTSTHEPCTSMNVVQQLTTGDGLSIAARGTTNIAGEIAAILTPREISRDARTSGHVRTVGAATAYEQLDEISEETFRWIVNGPEPVQITLTTARKEADSLELRGHIVGPLGEEVIPFQTSPAGKGFVWLPPDVSQVRVILGDSRWRVAPAPGSPWSDGLPVLPVSAGPPRELAIHIVAPASVRGTLDAIDSRISVKSRTVVLTIATQVVDAEGIELKASSGSKARIAQTDASGAFEFLDVSPGTARLSLGAGLRLDDAVARSRFPLPFSSANVAVANSGGALLLRTGMTPGEVRVPVRSRDTLRGRVVEAGSNRPIAGARVQAIPQGVDIGTEDAPLSFRPSATTTTNHNGEFEVSPLRAGRWSARVFADGFPPSESEARTLNQGESPSDLVVELGRATLRIELEGAPQPARGETRFALERVQAVDRLGAAPRHPLRTVVCRNGSASMTIAPGVYLLHADVNDRRFAPRAKSALRVTVELNETKTLRIEMVRRSLFSGRLLLEDGTPVTKGIITLVSTSNPKLGTWIQPDSAGFFSSQLAGEGTATIDSAIVSRLRIANGKTISGKLLPVRALELLPEGEADVTIYMALPE